MNKVTLTRKMRNILMLMITALRNPIWKAKRSLIMLRLTELLVTRMAQSGLYLMRCISSISTAPPRLKSFGIVLAKDTLIVLSRLLQLSLMMVRNMSLSMYKADRHKCGQTKMG